MNWSGKHVPAELGDRKLACDLQAWVSGYRHVGETVGIDAEVNVVAGAGLSGISA